MCVCVSLVTLQRFMVYARLRLQTINNEQVGTELRIRA